MAGRVNNLNGIQRLSTPFVRAAKGKGRFQNVTVCAIKLRNFESCHRGNATKASAWVDYIPTLLYVVMYSGMLHI